MLLSKSWFKKFLQKETRDTSEAACVTGWSVGVAFPGGRARGLPREAGTCSGALEASVFTPVKRPLLLSIAFGTTGGHFGGRSEGCGVPTRGVRASLGGERRGQARGGGARLCAPTAPARPVPSPAAGAGRARAGAHGLSRSLPQNPSRSHRISSPVDWSHLWNNVLNICILYICREEIIFLFDFPSSH